MVEKFGPKQERSSSSEWSLHFSTPLALTDMTNGKIPARDDVHLGKKIYVSLAREPLSIATVTKAGSNAKEFLMVGPALNAKQVNALLYFVAPYKQFGFDTYDVISDMSAIVESGNEDLRRAHATMPGWAQFEEGRAQIVTHLAKNYKQGSYEKQNKKDVLIPVIRWQTDAEGNRKIILGSLDEGLREELGRSLPRVIKDTSRLDTSMGLMHLATYSPDQTKWPTRSGYKHVAVYPDNSIGATQVLGFAYRQIAKQQEKPGSVPSEEDLQQSQLLAAMETYAVTGIAPSIDFAENFPIEEIDGESKKAKWKRRVNRIRTTIGGTIMAGGLLATGYGLVSAGVGSYKYVNLEPAAGTPTEQQADEAEGEKRALEHILFQHPEFRNTLQSEIDSAQRIISQRRDGLSNLANEKQKISNKNSDDVNTFMLGLGLVFLGGSASPKKDSKEQAIYIEEE